MHHKNKKAYHWGGTLGTLEALARSDLPLKGREDIPKIPKEMERVLRIIAREQRPHLIHEGRVFLVPDDYHSLPLTSRSSGYVNLDSGLSRQALQT